MAFTTLAGSDNSRVATTYVYNSGMVQKLQNVHFVSKVTNAWVVLPYSSVWQFSVLLLVSLISPFSITLLPPSKIFVEMCVSDQADFFQLVSRTHNNSFLSNLWLLLGFQPDICTQCSIVPCVARILIPFY